MSEDNKIESVCSLVKEDKRKECESMLERVYRELMWLNISMYFARKLSSFPFKKVVVDRDAFLYCTYMTYVVYSIIIVARLTDKSSSGISPHILLSDIREFIENKQETIERSELESFITSKAISGNTNINNSIYGVLDFCKLNCAPGNEDSLEKVCKNIYSVMKSKVTLNGKRKPIRNWIGELRNYRSKAIAHIDKELKVNFENLDALGSALDILERVSDYLGEIYHLLANILHTADSSSFQALFLPMKYYLDEESTDIDEFFLFSLKYTNIVKLDKIIFQEYVEKLPNEDDKQHIREFRRKAYEFFSHFCSKTDF